MTVHTWSLLLPLSPGNSDSSTAGEKRQSTDETGEKAKKTKNGDEDLHIFTDDDDDLDDDEADGTPSAMRAYLANGSGVKTEARNDSLGEKQQQENDDEDDNVYSGGIKAEKMKVTEASPLAIRIAIPMRRVVSSYDTGAKIQTLFGDALESVRCAAADSPTDNQSPNAMLRFNNRLINGLCAAAVACRGESGVLSLSAIADIFMYQDEFRNLCVRFIRGAEARADRDTDQKRRIRVRKREIYTRAVRVVGNSSDRLHHAPSERQYIPYDVLQRLRARRSGHV